MTYCGQRIRVNVLLRVWRDANRLIAQTYESIFKNGLAEAVSTIVHFGGVQPSETTVASRNSDVRETTAITITRGRKESLSSSLAVSYTHLRAHET